MLLLTQLDTGTSDPYAYGAMFVLGLGLGLVMQVLVLAVQNAVPYEYLGVATSGATLFRSIGGSIGTAVLGSIFTNRFDDLLAGGSDRIPAFTNALDLVFLVGACVIACAWLMTWALEERPLRGRSPAAASEAR